MALPIHKSRKVNYADYLTWPDGERWEIIDGMPYNMSPAPSRRHQKIISILSTSFGNFLAGKPCEFYVAPFDVRLSDDYSQDELIENVVQPDLSVFCDQSKLDDKGAIGAPDMAIEILSPSTFKKDMSEKMLLYQKFKVKEYWTIDPEAKDVRVFALDEAGRFHLFALVQTEGQFSGKLFPDLKVSLEELFEE